MTDFENQTINFWGLIWFVCLLLLASLNKLFPNNMTKLYSYVLRIDDGAAPNPFWGICTLTICKPAIRRTAQIGDWVIGTGSKNTHLKGGVKADFSNSIVYAMKVTDTKSLSDYDAHCRQQLQNKIPNWRTTDWRLRMGDCIYNFSGGEEPTMRKGIHNEKNKQRDLSGYNALLSDHFYYFGEAAIPLPTELLSLLKRSQGHRVITQADLITRFEKWIKQFQRNKIYADPQLRWQFDRATSDDIIDKCFSNNLEDDQDGSENVLC